MKVLVTGGAGYIGSTLVPMLLDKGHNVTVLDRMIYQQTSLLSSCHRESCRIINGDVRNQNLLREEVGKADTIIALAALVGAPLCDLEPETSDAVNRDAIKFISDVKGKDQKLLYPCTNSGYGIGQEGIHCDENSPLNPISRYGRQKVEAEKYILASGEAVSFRLATVFGVSPRMRLDLLVNDFTYRAFYDRFIVLFEAHFKRNYLYIRDAANAFLHGIENYDRMKGNAYNVGLSEANLNKEELCAEIKKQIPDFTYMLSEIGKDPDKRNYIVSNEKIESTGFKAETSLAQGITELKKSFTMIKRKEFANY